MVYSITLRPANAINALGSDTMRSPNIAKLAVTPPVVGAVHREVYNDLVWDWYMCRDAYKTNGDLNCIRLICIY